MKKQKLKSLALNKKTISNLQKEKTNGGGSWFCISTLRFFCTNHPTQQSDFCDTAMIDNCTTTTDFGGSVTCGDSVNDNSCNCTAA